MSEPVHQTPGQYRQDIYRQFETMVGRPMTEAEHKALKDTVQAYLLEHGAALVQARTPEPPKQHLIVCKDCKKEKLVSGQKGLDKGIAAMTRVKKHSRLKESNELLRSAHEIALRKGADTNWEAFTKQLDDELAVQHKLMHPETYDIPTP